MGFNEFGTGYGGGIDLFTIAFYTIFLIFILAFIMFVVKGISEWSYNNKQPILDIDCKVVSKRMHFSQNGGYTDANGHSHTGTNSTSYYVTFEFENKDRMEVHVSVKIYGSVVENDVGKLKFQGTRFLDFNRN